VVPFIEGAVNRAISGDGCHWPGVERIGGWGDVSSLKRMSEEREAIDCAVPPASSVRFPNNTSHSSNSNRKA